MRKTCLFFLLLVSLSLNASTLRGVGHDLTFSLYQFADEKLFIITYDSEGKYLLRSNSIIKITLQNDEVLILSGNSSVQQTQGKSISWIAGVESIKSSSTHTFCFEITSDIIKIFDIGIKRIAINTLPKVFVYSDDDLREVGKKLKKDFASLKDESE